jgi:PAS domain S-box-containing protein
MESMNHALESQAAAAEAEAGGADAPAREPVNSGAIPDPMSILDQARDAIVVLGLDGAVLYWNCAAERIFEWPAAEAMRRHAQDFLWADPRSVDAAFAGVLAGGAWNGAVTIATKSGSRRLVESRWSLLRDERTGSRSLLTIYSEMTEQIKVRDECARVQQLESIGARVREFAHDLNNVLGPILMAADLFKLTMKSRRELDLLETVEVSAKRGSEIVKRMLAFGKAHSPGSGEEPPPAAST